MSNIKNYVNDYPEPPELTDEYLDYEENIEHARNYIDKDIKRLRGGDTALAKDIITEDYYAVPTLDRGDLYFNFGMPKDIENYDYMSELEYEMEYAKHKLSKMLEFDGIVYKK